jgi:Fe-S-cluster containining protein
MKMVLSQTGTKPKIHIAARLSANKIYVSNASRKDKIQMVEPGKVAEMAQRFADKNSRFRIFLKKNADQNELDGHFHALHNEIFHKDDYDCCKCNNCCKIYDIRFAQKDIAAAAKYLGQADEDFIEKYLIPDDEDAAYFMLKDKPCRFLGAEGKCGIYECRPSVCREYPYTNKPERLYSMLSVLSFAEDCPVVFEIIERLKKIYNFICK